MRDDVLIENFRLAGRIDAVSAKEKKWLEPHRAAFIEKLKKKHGNDLSIRELITIEISESGVRPVCKTCGSHTRFLRGKFNLFCSNSCAQRHADTRAKMIEKWKNHGYTNPLNSSKSVEKRKQSNLTRYGSEHVMSSDKGRELLKQGMIEKYGVEFANQSLDVRKRAEAKSIEKYGVSHYFKTDAHKAKAREVSMKTRGVLHHTQDEALKEKFSALKSKAQIDKFKTKLPPKYRDCSSITELYTVLYENGFTSSRKIQEELGVSQSWVSTAFRNFYLDKPAVSFEEEKFAEEIGNVFHVNFEHSNRSILSGKEIDIWIPEHNLGIEYHGLYWHSADYLDRRVYDKFLLSRKANVNLLQFWSSDVNHKRDIVMSIVSTNLGKNDRIFARKCEVRNLTSSEHRLFCEENHLQGAAGASVRLGLFFKDELVSVMSFGKSRFSKKHEWEMIRFCNKKFTTVVGGASKLWKHFLKTANPKSVVTYADARISSGSLYRTLGFTFSHHSSPNYFYTKDFMTLESRVKYQKHKLKDLLERFDPDKTEMENMLSSGYKIVSDAGNLVFTFCS